MAMGGQLMSDILYLDRVLWYCQDCGDEGEADSQFSAEQQAAEHECRPAEKS
jgi:hypothetical protein